MKKEIRIANEEKKILQITTFDERWYAKDKVNAITGLPEYRFVPSVTWIAGHYPKGVAFYKWLASKGWDEAEAIKNAAGDKGSKIHLAVASLLDGNEVRIDSKFTNKSTGQEDELTPEEYEAVMSFVDWYEQTKPEVIAWEYVVWNDEEGYAGTVDLKCKIDDKTYIVDVKSSQDIWPEYELQVSAYKHADQRVDATAILQLGYRRNKTQKFKFTEIEDRYELFLAAKKIWAFECAGQAPLQKDYPMSLTLKPAEAGAETPKVGVRTKAKKAA